MTVDELPFYAYTWKKCTESEDWEARCLEIPDLSAYGETPEEALAEIKVAVCGWLEVLEQDGLLFPAPLYIFSAGQETPKTDTFSQPIISRNLPSFEMNQSVLTDSPERM